MKLIGRWWNGCEDYELYAPPQELVGCWPPAQKSMIVKYVYFDRENVDARVSMVYDSWGKQYCEFGCGTEWTMTEMHVRDSEWVWPVNLAHYVQHHDVMLPEDFIQHATSSAEKPWLSVYQEKSRIDDTYWMEWCRENRSYSERQAIKSSRDAQEIRRQEEIIERVKELERSVGISDTTCMYSGCSSMALTGKAFCAKCIVEKH